MRVAKWDNAKFFLMYCVVLGHFLNSIQLDSHFFHAVHLYIYIFHMPAFLFLSGLFSKKAVNERRFDKAASYLLLYIFMMIFSAVVYSFINGEATTFNLFSTGGVPWFALAVFIYYIVTMAVRKWNHGLVLCLALVLGIMAGYETNLGNFLVGMRAFSFYIFFYLGYLCPVDKLLEITRKKALKVWAAIILVVVFVGCHIGGSRAYKWLYFLKNNQTYADYGVPQWGGAFRAIYYAVALVMVLCVLIIIPEKKCIFSVWGTRTMQVFALHFPCIKILVQVLRIPGRLAGIWPLNYKFVIPVMAFLLTIALSVKIFEPFFTWITTPIKCARPGEKIENK